MSVSSTLLSAQNHFFHFDGTNDFALSNNTFNVDNTFTWEAMVFVHAGLQNFDGILAAHTPGPGSSAPQPRPQLGFTAAGIVNGVNNIAVTGTTPINDGQWHHVALVVNGTAAFIYIDGVLDGTGTSNITGSHPRFLAIATERSTAALYSPVLLDEVRIWDVARSQSSIQATMSTELIGNESNLLIYYNFNQGVCGGNNPTETMITDQTTNNNHATLNNIALTGCTSNWVCSGPTCSLANNNIVPAPSADVPTLSEWGLIILALLLMTLGTLYLVQPKWRVEQEW